MKKKIQRWYVRRIRLNSQGYDSSGCYWGVGIPLWCCYSADWKLEFHIRGQRDYAVCAYQWARNHKDPVAACAHLDATGRIGQ